MFTKLKILIVEDDRRIQAIYKKGLSDELFEKQFAGNGSEGLEMYSNFKPHVMILDIILPFMSGVQLLDAIRNKKKDLTTAIIMATGVRDEEKVRDCIRMGIQGYILKPIDFKTIQTNVLRAYVKADPERAIEKMGRLQVLVVEKDNPQEQDMYARVLMPGLFEVLFAGSGEEGLAAYRESRPDAIIIGTVLPDMFGVALLNTIRRKLKDQTTAIVMSTDMPAPDAMQECSRLGIHGEIVKKRDTDKIARILAQSYIRAHPTKAKIVQDRLEIAENPPKRPNK